MKTGITATTAAGEIVDIAYLDRDSLLRWLHSCAAPDAAERALFTLLGHEPPEQERDHWGRFMMVRAAMIQERIGNGMTYQQFCELVWMDPVQVEAIRGGTQWRDSPHQATVIDLKVRK